uniref:Secreted protein n=1 Tax=Anopheles christyi TaxID=43041 RepID=A0A182KII6_9DIPT
MLPSVLHVICFSSSSWLVFSLSSILPSSLAFSSASWRARSNETTCSCKAAICFALSCAFSVHSSRPSSSFAPLTSMYIRFNRSHSFCASARRNFCFSTSNFSAEQMPASLPSVLHRSVSCLFSRSNSSTRSSASSFVCCRVKILSSNASCRMS